MTGRHTLTGAAGVAAPIPTIATAPWRARRNRCRLILAALAAALLVHVSATSTVPAPVVALGVLKGPGGPPDPGPGG